MRIIDCTSSCSLPIALRAKRNAINPIGSHEMYDQREAVFDYYLLGAQRVERTHRCVKPFRLAGGDCRQIGCKMLDIHIYRRGLLDNFVDAFYRCPYPRMTREGEGE